MYEGYTLDKRLVEAVPSERQVAYHNLEFNVFIHFTVNTFTGKEWGDGSESESIFNPEKLDARTWAKAAKEGGAKGLILTCKHHDGFCLWPSKYTKHSVKNSPYKNGKGDVVREVSEACKEYGLKFGVYLSPWDRNSEYYGFGDSYNEYYINQLTELLTEYGDIFAVWLDGACGEGSNGKVQVYDWNGIYETVRRHAPGACIAICGPDIRWCGNESGVTREAEWSTVPVYLSDCEKVMDESQKQDDEGFSKKGLDSKQRELGTRRILKDFKNIMYYPSETDVSIRPGWFYHEDQDDKVKDFDTLKDIYLRTVGENSILLLNLPPTKEGLLHKKDVEVLRELGDFIDKSFIDNLLEKAVVKINPKEDVNGNDYTGILEDSYDKCFENPEGERKLEITAGFVSLQKLNYVIIKENILKSQRVEDLRVDILVDGEWKEFAKVPTVGYKRIISMGGIETLGIRIRIEDARVCPVISFVGVY